MINIQQEILGSSGCEVPNPATGAVPQHLFIRSVFELSFYSLYINSFWRALAGPLFFIIFARNKKKRYESLDVTPATHKLGDR